MAQFKMIKEEEQKEKLLEELYTLNDEYNQFVKKMDKRLDLIISKTENLNEIDDFQ